LRPIIANPRESLPWPSLTLSFFLSCKKGDFVMDYVANSPADIVTVKEVSEYFRVHASTVYRLLAKKQLPAFRVGSDWRFSLKAIDQWRMDAEATKPGS
jgi:excisionase family DNA binding protein